MMNIPPVKSQWVSLTKGHSQCWEQTKRDARLSKRKVVVRTGFEDFAALCKRKGFVSLLSVTDGISM